MTKDEYILRSLSKIKHKRWELFVVSRIVQALQMDDTDIEFVCQQLVRRPDGRRALTDIYFPQFRIFLEIDEPQHAGQNHAANDRTRTDDIISVAGLAEHRISVYTDGVKDWKSLQTIARETDAFIEELRQRKRDGIAQGTFIPWDYENRFDPARHIAKGHLHIKDNPVFRYQHHALRCFGYNKGLFQRGAWTLATDRTRCVWFPRLYETSTWENELSPDGRQITEGQKDGHGGYVPMSHDDEWASRYVCARYSDPLGRVLYRFIGEFEIDRAASSESKRIFVRIADTVPTISPQ